MRNGNGMSLIYALLLAMAAPQVLAQVVTGTQQLSITVSAAEGGTSESLIEGELISLSDVAGGVTVTSNPVTVVGGTPSTPFTVAGDGNPEVSVNGGPWVTSGSLSGGDLVRVRQTSSPTLSEIRTASLTVGGSAANWSVSTGVSLACTLSQVKAGVGTIWGFYPDDRVTLGVSGYGVVRLTNMSGTTGFSSTGPGAWAGDISAFCGWTGPVPVEIESFTATGATEDTARIRINEGPEVTSGTLVPGDKLQIVFTTSPQFGGTNAFRLRMNGGSGTYLYSHTNVSQEPNVLQPPTMHYTSYPALSVAHNYGNVTVANSTTVTSTAWTVPSLSVTKGQWYPSGQAHFLVETDNFPITGRAYASIDSSLSSAAATSVILRRGTTTIANGTEVLAGEQLTIRLTTGSTGSGVVRRRLAIQQVPGGSAALSPSPWEVTYPVPVPVVNFEDGYGVANTVVTSNAQTINGLGGCVSGASVTGTPFGASGLGALVNGSAVAFPSSFTLCDGNTLALRITTPNNTSWQPFTLTASSGGQTRTFRVTYGLPPMPDTFTPRTGAAGSSTYTSNTLTVSGITAFGGCNSFASFSSSFSLTNVVALVNGGARTSPMQLCNGDSIAMRATTPFGSSWTPQTVTLTPYTGKTVTWSISR